MPNYILETALKLIRKNVLKLEDDYIVTNHKIHLLPNNSKDQKKYSKRVNSMFKLMDMPLNAYRANSENTSGSIIISKSGINKELSLFHFVKANNLSINEVAKIGDMGDVDSLDNGLFKGVGSFSVDEFDFDDDEQVSLLLAKGLQYKGVNGTRWLLNNLKFDI